MPEKLSSARAILREDGTGALLAASLTSLADWLQTGVRRLRYANASYDRQIMAGLVERPFYGYCMYAGAQLARQLDHDAISVLEFGVGDGSGLRNIERHAERIEDELGTSFDVYGFDTGEGPPAPESYKDMPFAYEKDFTAEAYEGYAVSEWDSRATLVLGDVRDTVPRFFDEHDPPPVGCAFFDMNVYTSTRAGLELFTAAPENLMPRIMCHFDTVVSNEVLRAFNNDYVGENAAIHEFNAEHDDRKVAKVKYKTPWELGPIEPKEIYQFHHFDHPEYGTPVRTSGDDPFEGIYPGTERI